ncbi:MAG: hypothetical protein D3923_18345, partial [Candidatus Electrothrix sp. AR3]|nr:hypothetical protein [Candidatus Electrothrix sp. AR3]
MVALARLAKVLLQLLLKNFLIRNLIRNILPVIPGAVGANPCVRPCLFFGKSLTVSLVIVCALNTSAAATSSITPNVQQMNLAEAVSLALRHNRTVESASLDRLLEKFDLQSAEDTFLPDLFISASLNQEKFATESQSASQVGAETRLKVPTGGDLVLRWDQPV